MKRILPLLLAALLLTACQETDYMTFDTSHNGVYFKKDSVFYSFGVSPLEKTAHTLEIPVKVLGGVSGQPRNIAFGIVSFGELEGDTVAAVRGTHYNISSAVVAPGDTTGYISVEILRDNLEGSYETGYKRYRLTLQLEENENFSPTLTAAEQVITLTFDNSIDRPEWYDANDEKVWPKALGIWHPFKLIKMVEYYHAVEAIKPETYRRMVEKFRENLERMDYGDPSPFGTIFLSYIYRPMYQYFSNPANFDYIFTNYPDFPKNPDGTPEFPNPDA